MKMLKKITLILVILCFVNLSKADTQLNPSYTGDTQIQGAELGDLHFNYNFPTIGTGATTTTTISTTSTTTTTTTIKPLEHSGGSAGSYGGGAASGTGVGSANPGSVVSKGVGGIGVGLSQKDIKSSNKEFTDNSPSKINDADISKSNWRLSIKSVLKLIRNPFDRITGAVTAVGDIHIFDRIKYYNSNFVKNIKNIYDYIIKKILKK